MNFVCSRRTPSPSFVVICLRFGWKISVLKESYLKFVASGYQSCSCKGSEISEMTVESSISPNLFELER